MYVVVVAVSLTDRTVLLKLPESNPVTDVFLLTGEGDGFVATPEQITVMLQSNQTLWTMDRLPDPPNWIPPGQL